MPIYEYVCRDCRVRFEKLVRRWGEETECPSCASAAVDKQLSVFAVASASPSPACERGAGRAEAAACGGGGPCGGGACGLPS